MITKNLKPNLSAVKRISFGTNQFRTHNKRQNFGDIYAKNRGKGINKENKVI